MPQAVGARTGAEVPAAARACFAAAAEAAGVVEAGVRLAGTTVGLRFAGPGLVPAILPAFGDAACTPPAPGTGPEVLLWDTASTGVGPPEVPWSLGDLGPLGVLPAPHVGLHDPGAGRLVLVDRAADQALCCWAGPELPWYERGAPLRSALHGLLTGGSTELVHAGAVGLDGRGALLAGPSGAGKSTLALACLAAGLAYASDDYVLLGLEPRPVAHALYRTAKLTHDGADRLPALAPWVVARDEKVVLQLAPEQVERRLPVDLVVLPRLTGAARPAARRVPARSGLLALGPSSVLQAPGPRGALMATLGRAVRELPVHELDCGEDLDANVDALRELLA